ncbi:hypothetical protein GUITHDRAFT_154119 [Guillardia theta CCMP2712]|uniref:Uncharacterized protein n=1 Tax=Guillardia theta (strain CCMP2712) TaxID=905079 RepID=L1IVX3_GUITC|nr:hypothetical protein GUITHDRAFT_154119 [Guillardia theta CCMP2712]EKX40403.1 hypothetical protein GUITHDRAFT_154119 [Guillardia theta CCMP2712]|mmetsp:Transcript_926/g.2914  ORF Transcript_926/g.2914 Transcript_926/m.2914 type:complete len:151 (-) Transcript_926:1096-1548(-)|eukprot:XP_005827383.1 hypothetical protein GUITHDRAFT_154119 [Guillardia theta CCMP2712]
MSKTCSTISALRTSCISSVKGKTHAFSSTAKESVLRSVHTGRKNPLNSHHYTDGRVRNRAVSHGSDFITGGKHAQQSSFHNMKRLDVNLINNGASKSHDSLGSPGKPKAIHEQSVPQHANKASKPWNATFLEFISSLEEGRAARPDNSNF